jgi:hypothetical protein
MQKKKFVDIKCVTVYLYPQVNWWFIVAAKHDYLLLVSQDCEVIRFLSDSCAYEDNIASRYSDDKGNESDITGIDST